MLFFTFSNIDVYFNKWELIWNSYTIPKSLPFTQRVKLINKKKFAKTELHKNIKTFVLHVSFLSLELKITIYPARNV